jgi:hypothetical protein
MPKKEENKIVTTVKNRRGLAGTNRLKKSKNENNR